MTGSDLKEKRVAAGLKQEELAELVGMHKNTIYGYESKDFVPEKKASILELVLNEIITKKGLSSITKIESPEVIENKNGNRFLELPNGRFRIAVPKIPYTAYASFIEVFNDEYQLHESFEETYFTVDRIGRGRYIAFTTGNDSMNGGGINDTPGGAEVLAREVGRHLWQDGFHNSEYGFIIVATNGIFHKDIQNTDVPGKIICKSRNPSPEFPDFELILDDVHTIWKVIKRTF